jgi:hypothetical protein
MAFLDLDLSFFDFSEFFRGAVLAGGFVKVACDQILAAVK